MKNNIDNDFSLEKSLKRLDEISAKLNDFDIPLEQSLELFEEGAHLIKECNKVISEAEQKLIVLTENSDEDF